LTKGDLATIQLATSIHAGCYALISHDRDFEKSSEILVLG
jgi:predicted nucleic acid-binding protein